MNARSSWPPMVAAFVLAWAAASLWSMHGQGVAGFTTGAGGAVIALDPQGPAARAGLQQGDVLQGYRKPGQQHQEATVTARAGEIRWLDLLRDGQAISLEVHFEAASAASRWWKYFTVATGLLFMAIPAWGLWRSPGRLTRVLFLAGAGIGLAFLGEPAFSNPLWRAAAMALRNALVLAGVGAAVQFAFEYTRPGRQAVWPYWPMAAYWLVLDWRLLAPGASALAPLTGLLGSALLGLALASVLVVLTRAWIRGRRSAVPVLIGPVWLATLAGLLPLAVASGLRSLLPEWMPPTRAWFLALLLVPLAWTLAAVAATREKRSEDARQRQVAAEMSPHNG